MALYTQEKRQQLQHKLCKPGDNSDIFKALKGKKKKKKKLIEKSKLMESIFQKIKHSKAFLEKEMLSKHIA